MVYLTSESVSAFVASISASGGPSAVLAVTFRMVFKVRHFQRVSLRYLELLHLTQQDFRWGYMYYR